MSRRALSVPEKPGRQYMQATRPMTHKTFGSVCRITPTFIIGSSKLPRTAAFPGLHQRMVRCCIERQFHAFCPSSGASKEVTRGV